MIMDIFFQSMSGVGIIYPASLARKQGLLQCETWNPMALELGSQFRFGILSFTKA